MKMWWCTHYSSKFPLFPLPSYGKFGLNVCLSKRACAFLEGRIAFFRFVFTDFRGLVFLLWLVAGTLEMLGGVSARMWNVWHKLCPHAGEIRLIRVAVEAQKYVKITEKFGFLHFIPDRCTHGSIHENGWKLYQHLNSSIIPVLLTTESKFSP